MAREDETNQYIYHFQPVRDGFDPESLTPQEIETAERHYVYLKAATERGEVRSPAAHSTTRARRL